MAQHVPASTLNDARRPHDRRKGYDIGVGDAICSRITRSSETMRISSRPAVECGRGGGGWYGFVYEACPPYPPLSDGRLPYGLCWPYWLYAYPCWYGLYCWCCEAECVVDGGVSAKRMRRLLPCIICDIAPVSTCRISTKVGSKART